MLESILCAFGSLDSDDLFRALEITWKGLVAILIVIAIIIIATLIINALSKRSEEKKKAAAKDENGDSDGTKTDSGQG